MKLINQALSEKGLKLKELSPEIQKEINDLREMIVKYNMAVSEYENDGEEDEEVEKKLDETEDTIAETEQSLAEKIKAFEKLDANTPPANNPPVEKKKDNTVGWLIFAGVVAVATLGSINLFNKK